MELTMILAGPILRRVDADSVTIWIATSRPFDIDACVYDISTDFKLPTKTHTSFIRAGQQLFIYLVHINGNFPVDTLLGYDLFFHNEIDSYTFASLGLTSANNEQSITYGDLAYPSFFIPGGKTSNFLYASCRKFHGKGEDALAAGDELLQITRQDLEKRPSALFLLGDQIYADDVADPLFPVIQTVAGSLNTQEDLTQLDSRLADLPFNKSSMQVNGRQFIMEQFCQFTSTNASNHLMTFGEYAAMYLLSWSPSLWETACIPSFDEVLETDGFHFIFPDDEAEQVRCKARYNRQSEDLLQTIGALHQVRRLLANVPTYMIFDDHDVTDDWNLSANWHDRVSQSALGKHVISNGLFAYWAFQGWGNEPQRFAEEFLLSMGNHVDGFIADTPAYEEWTEQLWTFRNWHFVAPTNPAALFLNTRTMRSFDDAPQPVKIGWTIKENVRSPRLISPRGWRSVSETLVASGWKKGNPLIIVSPTPVYGIGLIESVLHSYVYPLRALGIPVDEAFDFEAWKYNGKGFNDFIRTIFKWQPSRCIILSGDVHYASAVTSHIKSKTGKVVDIIQFTSSPSNNMSFTGVWGLFMRMAILLNAQKRKGKKIQRYCDETYKIVNGKEGSKCPNSAGWREELRYVPTGNGSIVETKNNIGFLSIHEDSLQNALLRVNEEKISFERLK